MSVKLLTLLLAIIMALGCVPFMTMTVTATAAATSEDDEAKKEEERIKLFLTTVYKNVDEKLATFGGEIVQVNKGTAKSPKWVNQRVPDGKPILVKDGYELYYQYDTGEIAVKDQKTGQILFSNPYDVGAETSAESQKIRLLSQLIIEYLDADKKLYFESFKAAALYRQIKMKTIKGGIRVEYTIGKEEKRKLVPRMIERSSFENNILSHITNQRELDKMNAYYTLKDAKADDLTERARKELQVTYPMTKDYAIYVFDPNASERELTQIEGYIKMNAPEYTFEKMDEDHALLGYEPKDKAPPLFKMALEYYIDEDGLYMRLPANGIRFDESTYRLSYINVLPFMGCGRRENTGYTFTPDGSGALVRYEDIKDQQFTSRNKIYGPDFSFKKITGGAGHTMKWRLPVFGATENFTISREIKVEQKEFYYNESGAEIETPIMVSVDDAGEPLDAPVAVYYNENGEKINSALKFFVDADGNKYEKAPPPNLEDRSDGFIAIIEDGDAMAEIQTIHEGSLHKYNAVSAMFTPRPVDEYNLDFETKGISSLITVSSRRKYAGNYIIRYIMLSSDENGKPKKPNGYEASYVGMAKAYRDYLQKNGLINRMEDTGEDIPLFIESLGTLKTSEFVFGMPMILSTPLTTFEDIESIVNELNGEGIYNLKFRLNGWINGGLRGTAPAKLKIEKKMGGKKGLQALSDFAKQKGVGIYPDMNFATVWYFMPFDGTYRKKDQVYHMDQMMAREQRYFFLAQDFMFYQSDALIAPERMELMYNKAMKEYGKYEIGGLSVVKLAAELHSNHYKKSLVNRMESMGYSTELMNKMVTDNGSLLAMEANAYSFKYLDSIIQVDLDSSRFMYQSEAVPFYGMVTHGFINIAGQAINMSGDYQYDILKAIENGASPYFILAYRNANRLKEAANWSLNSYYAVDYKTWLPSMLETYKKLNDALKPVRAKLIIGHEFLGTNIVQVTYEGGISFILNYFHDDPVTVTVGGKEYTVPPLDFIKIS